jgi:virginiamycin B lyase
MRTRALIAAGAVITALGMATTASAAANLAYGSTAEYPAGPGGAAGSMATGPDGNVWYSYLNMTSPGGGLRAMATGSNQVLGSYPLPVALFPLPYQDPSSLVVGPDGRLWFTQGEGPGSTSIVGAITTSGTYSAYALPAGTAASGITAGANNNMWIVGGSAILNMSVTGTIQSFPLPAGVTAQGAPTIGPDGAVWFAASQSGTGSLGRMTTSGSVSVFPLPALPGAKPGWSTMATALGVSPTNVIWATVVAADPIGDASVTAMVASQTTGSMGTVAALPNYSCVMACEIVSAPDGNGWTTSGNTILRVTPGGVVTAYTVVTKLGGAQLSGLILGPDRNLWFTDSVQGNVGALAIRGGAPIPALRASMINGYRGKSATRGKKLSVIFEAGQSAAGQSRITISRKGVTVQLWKGNVRPGATSTISGTVPKSFPKGTATVALVTPKSAGKASTTVTVK